MNYFILANTKVISDSTLKLTEELQERGWRVTEPDEADFVLVTPDFNKMIHTIGSGPVIKNYTNIANFIYRNFLL